MSLEAGSARIAVLGTGANGAGIGADLTRAGHDVTFIEQWPAHVEAMRANGVRVEMPEETQTTPVRVHHLCEVAEMRQPFDLVFVLVKAYDTRWACELIKPVLAADGLAVGLQNGMQSDDMVEILGSHRTLGAVIEVSSNMFEPGVVERQSPPGKSWFAVGSLSDDTLARVEPVAQILRASGTVEVSDDIRSSKWMKLVANAAELVPSAILDLPLGDAVRMPGMREFMIETGHEAVRTALASGRRLMPIFGMTDDDIAKPDDYAVMLLDRVLTEYTLPSTRTTVLQDWMKGRRSEVHEINGLVVRTQAQLGGRAPFNERVVEVATRIEAGELTASPDNIALLLA
ncbi:ketopantoate reductase family protein [Microcella sp.]|uniref:ketopantoate reductase family protein n=1 Tax=Microcella sp. TaxID=1913979 RepID=UPI00256E4EEF|nr:2-dehydropantoate 2-reductase [Microcella sp.]MBX9472616.1 2-dehydropantoate 2-reductase [Microcella sp.]